VNATPQFERVRAVEDTHWWFVSLREAAIAAVTRRHPPGARILDAGCGTGALLRDLGSAYELTGVDVNTGALAVARERTGAELLEASVEQLPFADAAFDAVVSLDVLYAAGVSDDVAALREIARVVRPGGTVVLNLPAYEWLRSGHDVVAQTARRYTRRRVLDLIAAAGLEPERVTYRVTAVFPAVVATRLTRRQGGETDVAPVAESVNRILLALARAENRMLEGRGLPFGLSVFAIARKAGA
jgi:ubiquinone/menaquinone biosynthesis C-methylase UbiE